MRVIVIWRRTDVNYWERTTEPVESTWGHPVFGAFAMRMSISFNRCVEVGRVSGSPFVVNVASILSVRIVVIVIAKSPLSSG